MSKQDKLKLEVFEKKVTVKKSSEILWSYYLKCIEDKEQKIENLFEYTLHSYLDIIQNNAYIPNIKYSKPEYKLISHPFNYIESALNEYYILKYIEPEIVNNKFTVEDRNYSDQTPLMAVFANKDKNRHSNKFIDYFIKNGADVNAIDSYGSTALMYSCLNVNIKDFELLLEYGADVNIRDRFDCSIINYLKINNIKKHVSEDPSIDILKKINSFQDGRFEYFLEQLSKHGLEFKKEDDIEFDLYTKLSHILSSDYQTLPIPLFTRNSPSWVFSELDYLKLKEENSSLYLKIINWD